jgi:dihydropteroate synthase
MGIVNVTPDSFSDGGRFLAHETAIEHGLRLHREGAAIIDVGGESTRPGALPVPPEEEIRRVVPVVRGLAEAGVKVSIDTRNAATMRAALAAGAAVLNDVSALTHDPESLEVAASSGVPVVLMHAQGDPRTMQLDPTYGDVVQEIHGYLATRIEICVAAGIERSLIVVDPGIGFGKTSRHNLLILKHLRIFRDLGRPVLLGVSRKGLISVVAGSGPTPADRLPGSIAAALAGLAAGCHILRVHDVAETRQAVAIWQAIAGA